MRFSNLFPLFSKTKQEVGKPDTQEDFSYITKELYKKNLELDYKNKMLLLLEKIDEIILSKVVDLKEIANEVTRLLIKEAEFRLTGIYVLSPKQTLWRLAVSVTDKISLVEKREVEELLDEIANKPPQNNIFYVVVQKKEMKSTENPYITITKNIVEIHGAEEILTKAGLKSILVYPLIKNEQSIGVVIFSLGKTDIEITSNDKDLMSRLSTVIAIAIENTLLYQNASQNSNYLKAEEHP